jgi:S-formylglutathione hydrolase FrmB
MRNRKFAPFAAALAPLALLAACAGLPRGFDLVKEPVLEERSAIFVYSSAAVASGLAAGRNEHYLFVRLPASYAASPGRRYPVVYTFHGFGDAANQVLTAVGAAADASAAAGGPEYILVGVDGGNYMGGSFYADSPATGDWETMLLREVVPFVEGRFRCLRDRNARALAGFSMGGFAAWRLALAHADSFAAFWAACPGALEPGPGGLAAAMPTWNGAFRRAYGAVFAPDTNLPAPYARIPAMDGSAADQAVVDAWESGFGAFDAKIAAYSAKPDRLTAARFEYGRYDGYGWIVSGTVALEAALRAAGVPTEIGAWDCGHTVSKGMVDQGFVPFFAKVFAAYR